MIVALPGTILEGIVHVEEVVVGVLRLDAKQAPLSGLLLRI